VNKEKEVQKLQKVTTVTGNKVSSGDELTQYHSEVNQDEIQTVESRTTTKVKQLKKWLSDMVLNKATSAQMTEPKTIQEALSIPNKALWKSAMQEYDSLMEMKLEAGRQAEKPEDGEKQVGIPDKNWC
jgi:hypothetical protein